MRLRWWVLLLILSVSGPLRADDSVSIQPDSCFADMAPRGGVYPILVSLHNGGPSVDGALTVTSASYSSIGHTYAYPVSLPTGTNKEIIVYPAVSPNSQKVDFSFDGPARVKEISLGMMEREGKQVGMIGDEIGALSTLRFSTSSLPSGPPGRPASENRYNDCYAKPEAAPDRAAGYQSMSVLVLAGGAERLRPEQWTAIRHWVLDGGSLILVGGAGATYLRLREAAALLPIQNLQETSVPALILPPAVRSQPLPAGTVGLVSGAPRPGSTVLATQGGHVVLARQALGAGTVLFVGFNPLEKPFRGWAGQHTLWLGLINQASATISTWSLHRWTVQQTSFTQETSRTVGAGPGVNPFRVTLPPLATVAWLFLAYFLLVIPVTHILLKRLGRLELAWATSPLISVGFACIFYLFTTQLYQAGMSRRTAGVIVATAGDPNAQFDGFSEMFFPRGGSYHVSVPGAEALEMSPFSSSEEYSSGYYPGSSDGTQPQPLQTVDLGDVSAPDFQMGNLAFRRLYHTEPVSLGGQITATLTGDPAGGLAGTVRNGTAQTLTGCGIFQSGTGRYIVLGDLAPGETKRVGSAPKDVRGLAELSHSPFADLSLSPLQLSGRTGTFLIGRTSGERFGPTLGRDVGGPQSVALLVSLPVAARKP